MITLENIDWEKFKEYLFTRSSNKKHINNMLNYARKYYYLLNSNPLDFAIEIKKISEKKRSLKRHILQALANLSRFLDLVNESEVYYERFKQLRKKANISWSEERSPFILKEPIRKEEIIAKINSIKNKKLKATAILHLLTGLRTGELFFLIKNFERLKKIEIGLAFLIELNFIRRTKKVFITILHKDAIKFIQIAYKSKKSYWKNIAKIGIKPYVFRRLFESIYSELRSHEIDLLQGRLSSELVVHYTRDIESLVSKISKMQEKILKKMEI